MRRSPGIRRGAATAPIRQPAPSRVAPNAGRLVRDDTNPRSLYVLSQPAAHRGAAVTSEPWPLATDDWQ